SGQHKSKPTSISAADRALFRQAIAGTTSMPDL
ncbi:uncharacterized protein METZ01_LOCUS242570, partial [marine metagenome]